MADPRHWLIVDLAQLPGADDPLLADVRTLAGGHEPGLHDTGQARYLAVPLAPGADPDLADLLARPQVRRAWVQDDDIVLAGHQWAGGAPGFAAPGWTAGGRDLLLIAGPCAVESAAQVDEVAAACAEAGARWLRGGAWKSRTSPYEFQGLGARGLELLRAAADRHGLHVVTEAIGTDELPAVLELSDVVQIGSRNAQNFALLRRVGAAERPVLLKRGFGCTTRELVYGAEYVMAHGNPRVLVCERGIRSFEQATRFTFDLNAIPLLKQTTHLPVIADPSHGTGQAGLVPAVARGAVAAGADGLMIEVHPDPRHALSDGRQAVGLSELGELVAGLRQVARAVGRAL